MATFMFQGCYTPAAIAAMVKNPEDRTVPVRELLENFDGKLESFWLAFGDHDFVGIAQLPNSQAAAAFAMAATAGGSVHHFRTIELLPWGEGVKAFKKAAAAKYRPPTTPAK